MREAKVTGTSSSKNPLWADPGFFMHKEIKSSCLSQIPFTFIKICVDVEYRQYIRGWYIKYIFKTGAYFKCFLTKKKHKWSFSRPWLRCHLCHIWASKIEMTPNHMLKCMESVMKWEPITSGKERELQQAYPVCVSDLEYRCNDAEDMLYLSGLTFCPPEKKPSTPIWLTT